MALAVGGATVVASVIGAKAWTLVGLPSIAGLPDAGALVTVGSPVLRALTTAAGVATLALLVLALSVDPARKGGTLSRLGRRDATLAARAAGAWTVLAVLQAMWVFADVLAMPVPQAWSPSMVAAFWWEVPQIRALILVALLAAVAAAHRIGQHPSRGRGSRDRSVGHRDRGTNCQRARQRNIGSCPAAGIGHGTRPGRERLGRDRRGPLPGRGARSARADTGRVTARPSRRGRGHRSRHQRHRQHGRPAEHLVRVGVHDVRPHRPDQGRRPDTCRPGRLHRAAPAPARAAAHHWTAASLCDRRRRGGLALLVAFGAGSALATSAPPRIPIDLPTLAETLAGFAFPAPPTFTNVVLSLRLDPLFLIAGLAAGVLYVAAVIRLRRRGDAWPWGRTISWLLGIGAFLWATNAGISAYANIAAGLHMGQHMALTMLIPILLVMGAPATLALRALRPRSGPGWGPREWLVYLLHCPAAVILTNPLVVMVLYFAGLYGLYLSGLFGTLMGSHVGHVAMQTHFVLSGYLFYWILIGIDPRPRLLPYWQRFMLLIISSALHGFFAVIIMMSEAPVAVEWFSAVRPPWVTDLLQDTVLGGQAAWAIGEFPLLIVAIALAVQWSRSDERDARRMDRQADRDGGQELASYNAYLAQLNSRATARDRSSNPEAPQ